MNSNTFTSTGSNPSFPQQPPRLIRRVTRVLPDGTKETIAERLRFDAVLATGRKGLTLQRYKGLGEMNPEQLWTTTLDTNERSLLQVKIKEVDEADDIFTKLMGDVVEPRREFIETNARDVVNLDV